jgi:hypothetical protein
MIRGRRDGEQRHVADGGGKPSQAAQRRQRLRGEPSAPRIADGG